MLLIISNLLLTPFHPPPTQVQQQNEQMGRKAYKTVHAPNTESVVSVVVSPQKGSPKIKRFSILSSSLGRGEKGGGHERSSPQVVGTPRWRSERLGGRRNSKDAKECSRGWDFDFDEFRARNGKPPMHTHTPRKRR